MKKLFIFFLLVSQLVCAQTDEIEMLNNKLKTFNSSDSKIKHLDSIINNSDNRIMLLEANHQLGKVYYKNNLDFNLANSHLRKALQLVNNNDYKKAKILLSLGFLNRNNTKLDTALYFFNKALAVSKTTNNNKLISQVYSNIAYTYDAQEIDHKLTLEFYKKAIVIGKKSNRKLGTTYNNLGVYFLEKNVDSAIVYFKKSLKEATKNKSISKEIRAHTNLGIAYFENRNYNKAFKTLKKVENLAINNNNNTSLLYINLHLAKYYEQNKQHQKALDYLNKAYNSSYLKTKPLQYIEVLKDITSFYEKQENFKKANNFQKQYHHLKDSIYSVKKNKDFNEIKTKYEVVEKDNKINLLTKEKDLEQANKRAIIITAIAILSLLLLLTYFLKHKIKIQKEVRIKEQILFEQELKTKKALSLIEGQENEQHRLAKELHDGLGGQLAGVKSIIQTITVENIQEKTQLVDLHLDTSIKNLRNISHDLSAHFLKNENFDILVQKLVHQNFSNTDIQTEISIFPSNKFNNLSEQYQLHIYRMLQESFQNILKHAKATYISVSLSLDQEINLLIEDNGIGFEYQAISNGIGLQNIKDRLQSLNGNLYIDSEFNKGTTLNISIPIKS